MYAQHIFDHMLLGNDLDIARVLTCGAYGWVLFAVGDCIATVHAPDPLALLATSFQPPTQYKPAIVERCQLRTRLTVLQAGLDDGED